jgi:hypothetical protein
LERVQAPLPVAFHNVGVKEGQPRASLFPSVGLQTPGEEVEVNFGQQPFMYDIEKFHQERAADAQATVQRVLLPGRLCLSGERRHCELSATRTSPAHLSHHILHAAGLASVLSRIANYSSVLLRIANYSSVLPLLAERATSHRE